MTLHLHRSERADPLVAGLARVLQEIPADPFAPDLVAVPARGVERWLTQRLSHHLGSTHGDGVCANVEFPSPSTLTTDAVTAASGTEPADDPWAPGRMVWTLLEVIDECATEPWCQALGRHHGRPGRRFVVAQHVAGLFGSYARQRPAMIRAWARGDDTDGTGAALDEDVTWEPGLWRRLRERLATPSPAERLEPACQVLRSNPGVVDLPRRVSLFGPTGLTTEQVTVLAALAHQRDVHLWLPHPSAVLWAKVSTAARPHRRNDPTRHAPQHQLLASLGRDTREMQLLLADLAPAATDEHLALDDGRGTLLGRIQHGLRTDEGPVTGASAGRPPLDVDDRSLQVHACHGRARQVEVLREVLLGLLEADRTLEARDVLVMCPDIEAYAPLISATFGLAIGETDEPHPGHRLPVRLADRALRQTNPQLATLDRLLDLADARVTASQVLDLAAMSPVSRRFGLDDDELERLRGWVATSGIRWGIDAPGRAPFQMEAVAQNTWQAGLDRVLLGVTMSEEDLRWIGVALPLDDVDSTDIDLAGRFAELLDRLGATLRRLSVEQPLSEWLDSLGEALESLTATTDADAWQLAQARRELAEVATAAGEQAATATLTLADVRTLLADRLAGRPTRAGFRTGNLTMCSMVPMRSVPHRVICLLGLDDGVFPRTSGVDGDDILARDPLVGERDRRSEDRQLLLDAVLAAQEHLVVLYTGADERTNTPCPPAVPVAELLDIVDATVRTSDARPARDHVVVHHPLQPFDARNFTDGVLGVDGPFSFDRTSLAGAQAASAPRGAADPFLARALDPMPDTDTVYLDALIRFVEHPVRGFLRQRLGVAQPEEGEVLDDALHAVLAPLDSWAVGNRWLEARLGGADEAACRDAEWRRGMLPPGRLGTEVLADVMAKAEPLLAAAMPEQRGEATAVDVQVVLPDGRTLSGTVPEVRGHTVARAVYSRLGAKHRLRAWVQLLALVAAHPDQRWRAVTIGRGRGNQPVARSTMSPPVAADVMNTLADLVELHDRGLCEPLPLPPAAGLEYATLRSLGDDENSAFAALDKKWKDQFEQEDPDLQRVWGQEISLAQLAARPATARDQADGIVEGTLLGALACRLWFPVLAAETLDHQ